MHHWADLVELLQHKDHHQATKHLHGDSLAHSWISRSANPRIFTQVAKLLSLGLIIVGGCMALYTPQGRARFENPWEVERHPTSTISFVSRKPLLTAIIVPPFHNRAQPRILAKLRSPSILEYSATQDGTISTSWLKNWLNHMLICQGKFVSV